MLRRTNGDARLTKRAVKTAELMMRHPGGTLPQKLNADADLDDLDGFYNFANNPKVNHDTVLGGHVEQTRERLVLWRGWTKLQLLVDGAAGRSARCAET